MLCSGLVGRPVENSASSSARSCPCTPATAPIARGIGDAPGDSQVRMKSAIRQCPVDLRPRAMHDHQARAQHVQQRQVVHDVDQVAVQHGFAAQQDDEGPAAVGADIRGRSAEPAGVLLGFMSAFQVGAWDGYIRNCNRIIAAAGGGGTTGIRSG